MYNYSLTTMAQSKIEYCKNNCFEVITGEWAHQSGPAFGVLGPWAKTMFWHPSPPSLSIY